MFLFGLAAIKRTTGFFYSGFCKWFVSPAQRPWLLETETNWRGIGLSCEIFNLLIKFTFVADSWQGAVHSSTLYSVTKKKYLAVVTRLETLIFSPASFPTRSVSGGGFKEGLGFAKQHRSLLAAARTDSTSHPRLWDQILWEGTLVLCIRLQEEITSLV